MFSCLLFDSNIPLKALIIILGQHTAPRGLLPCNWRLLEVAIHLMCQHEPHTVETGLNTVGANDGDSGTASVIYKTGSRLHDCQSEFISQCVKNCENSLRFTFIKSNAETCGDNMGIKDLQGHTIKDYQRIFRLI